MFSLKSLKSRKISDKARVHTYSAIFFLFLQTQRPTLEHTEVSEEPAKGVQL